MARTPPTTPKVYRTERDRISAERFRKLWADPRWRAKKLALGGKPPHLTLPVPREDVPETWIDGSKRLRYFSLADLSRIWHGFPKPSLEKLCRMGILPARQIGVGWRKWRVSEYDAQKFCTSLMAAMRHALDQAPRQVVREFNGRFAPLANTAPCRIHHHGKIWNSVEHAYQGSRAERGTTVQAMLHDAETPELARALANRRGLPRPPDAESLMLTLLRQKFAHPEYQRALLSTGEAHLEEANAHGDTYWGTDVDTGVGENRLGALLMAVRDEIGQRERKRLEAQETKRINAVARDGVQPEEAPTGEGT